MINKAEIMEHPLTESICLQENSPLPSALMSLNDISARLNAKNM